MKIRKFTFLKLHPHLLRIIYERSQKVIEKVAVFYLRTSNDSSRNFFNSDRSSERDTAGYLLDIIVIRGKKVFHKVYIVVLKNQYGF